MRQAALDLSGRLSEIGVDGSVEAVGEGSYGWATVHLRSEHDARLLAESIDRVGSDCGGIDSCIWNDLGHFVGVATDDPTVKIINRAADEIAGRLVRKYRLLNAWERLDLTVRRALGFWAERAGA